MKISLILVVPLVAVVLAACGTSAPASAPADQREAALKFAQWMREHSVDMAESVKYAASVLARKTEASEVPPAPVARA
ncbi:unnamed protein product [[Actinomadura] parvosata subsp. kistnae]|uniref:Uncharacterized protein n=1 Tax=[Actinomadura] parvosata subsp. kistnae TaxID=1909395 RepID=A0A1U9ZWJ6_9ACTN|nr:hypothetical protein [Nonomuraea sp. ATCC 55076]AQZ62328.1 hypothetical protein BKM31_13405 [Nonomuraea sp. ATCC 55076]SPL99662.1 unnamed protein product [Actinomadura parvosata subsp. kistnae]